MAGILVDRIIERVRREYPDGQLRYPDEMIRQFCHMAMAMGEDLLELHHTSTLISLTESGTWYDLPNRCISIESVGLVHPDEAVPRGQLGPVFEDDMHDGADAWETAVGDPRKYMLRSCPGIPALPGLGTVSKIRLWPTVGSNDGYRAMVNYLSFTSFTTAFTGGMISDWLVDTFFMPYVRMLISANGKRAPFLSNAKAFIGGIEEARSMIVNPIDDVAPGFHGFDQYKGS